MRSWHTQPSASRTYHDPLHGAIALDRRDPVEALLIQLIDTPEFQRLRRIRQLGPASLTFHGAEGSRFTHSIGVMAIARRAFDRLAYRHPVLRPHRAAVLCAALLHDIGHGPFSHTCEDVFGCEHEAWTLQILQTSEPIHSLLNAFDPDLVGQLEHIYHKQHPVPLVWQLVSSQLDCDRLDYLMRDSHFTGASYGQLDLDRILMALDYDPEQQQLVVLRKGMAAIEHYLIVRYFMHAQVYNHPKNLAATWILDHAIQRARQLVGNIPTDDTMTAWLVNAPTLTLRQYLDADDGLVMYHLQRWQHHDDLLLSDLCRRFIHRDLPKALDVTEVDAAIQQQMVENIQSWLRSQGLSPVYVGQRTALSSGYTLYQRGIKLKTEHGFQDISDLSPLVKTLSQPARRHWLIYPRNVDPNLLKRPSVTPS
jgi:HD superfamily phosphohydrolase